MRSVRSFAVAVTLAMLGLALPLTAGASTPAEPPGDEPVATPTSNGFNDVASSAFFAQPVTWLVAEGLTSGYGSPTTFAPSIELNRAQMALFLWRLMGEPEPESEPCGFTDTASRPADVRAATCWMKEQGITTGINDEGTLYGPWGPVTRGQMGAFLYRLAGGASDTPTCGFTDAPQNPEFALASCWLKANGITTGTNSAGTTFSPRSAVTRGQMATFLFRLIAAPQGWTPARLNPERTRCEVLDPRGCLLPFPSDAFAAPDGTTDTGLRLDIPSTATPANKDGKRIETTDINRNDGFSPGSVLLTYLPGVDLAASGAAPITDIAQSVDPSSPVLLIHAETGTLHPHWVEYDSQPANPEDRLLSIVPARNFEPGGRYLVALRNLVAEGTGDPVEAGEVFAALRDGTPTELPLVEARRERMTDLLAEFPDANPAWDPADFVLAWEFTVASTRNLTERILHMRDQSLGPLAGSRAPTFTAARLASGSSGFRAERIIVDGTITVPNYQRSTVSLPLKGGAPFNWGPDGLPRRNTVLRNLTTPYRCVMPSATVLAARGPARVSMYGHGLLGSYTEINSEHIRDFADEHNVMFCAVSWHGFSGNDILNALDSLRDLSKFPAIADGGQQGLLHQMFLGRLMIHPNGFVAHPAFRSDTSGAALLDTSQLGYDGNSQGGIMGGALVAVSPDLERGVLGVPGMNYSVLLYRSSDWPSYAQYFNPAYPREIERPQALGLAQIMWDRIEANGYMHYLNPDNPLPGTPAKQVMLHVAYADHQVAVVAADNMARTAGIPLYDPPALASGRAALWGTPGLGDNPDVDPFWGIERLVNPQNGQALTNGVYVMWDSGNTPPPVRNVPPGSTAFGEPDAKKDPHERPRRAPGSRQQKFDFMFGGTLTRCPTWDIDANPANGSEAELCLAPFPDFSYPWLPGS